MFRLDEFMPRQRLHKPMPLFSRDRLIAQRAKGMKIDCELRFPIHGKFDFSCGGFEMLPPYSVYSSGAAAAEVFSSVAIRFAFGI